jgi:hypothetical protein
MRAMRSVWSLMVYSRYCKAPAPAFLSEVHHPCLLLCVDWRTTWRVALPRTVALLGDPRAVPGESRVGFHTGSDLLQSEPPELCPILCQALTLAIAQPHATLKLVAEDAIFCNQIGIVQQGFLVHYSGDVGEQLFPIHVCVHLCPYCFSCERVWGIVGGKSRQGAGNGGSINAGKEMQLSFLTIRGTPTRLACSRPSG